MKVAVAPTLADACPPAGLPLVAARPKSAHTKFDELRLPVKAHDVRAAVQPEVA